MAIWKADKHSFKLVGGVAGIEKKNFYSVKETKSGKTERLLNFRVKFNKDGSEEFVELKGYSGNAYVYDNIDKKSIQLGAGEYKEFMKKEDAKIAEQRAKVKTEKEKYAIKNRYSLAGVAIKVGDMKEVENMTAYDGAEYLANYIRENPDVILRVMGDIEYSAYRKDGELKTSRKLAIKRIFESDAKIMEDNYEPEHFFSSEFTFTEAVTGENPTIEGYTVVRGASKGEFVVIPVSIDSTEKLANDFKRAKVKPYSHLKFEGRIMSEKEVENVVDVKQKSFFGEETSEYTKNPYASAFNRYLLLTRADAETIDEEKYTKDDIDSQFQNQKLFGDDVVEETNTLGDMEKKLGESTSEVNDYSEDEFPF